ncbi:hypothetical protein Ddye_006827 [Dipteronia dyeriana]|uniref:Coenzyme Q-binding protein COQ10 START domain-containing protein n=1 Tax=Dipteronia dyeriana TaxID=168575 RepID=A0AAE0CR24_9ROSI|nr:hypothetical protein Ddye_006827 [Dipteronia dyeriana]
MPPFMSASKAIGSAISRKTGARHLINSAKFNAQLPKPDQIRRFSSIAGVETPSVRKLVGSHDFIDFSAKSFCNGTGIVQRRQFLGCGDGEEGDVLSKVYEERRVLGKHYELYCWKLVDASVDFVYSEQLFDVVAAVDLYHGFVPWCQRSEILRHNPDGSFDAELEIGFKFLVESYVSHVELNRPKSVKTTVSESALFDHLINFWEFSPGPVPGSCSLYFLVDFKFQSPLYRQPDHVVISIVAFASILVLPFLREFSTTSLTINIGSRTVIDLYRELCHGQCFSNVFLT